MQRHLLGMAALTAVLIAGGVSSASAATTVENGDPSIGYQGWTTVTDAGAAGGSYRESAVAGDQVKFVFSGTSVAWQTRVGPNEGKAKVTLDGVSQGTVNEYAATAAFTQTVFTAAAAGKHTLVVRVLGRHVAASTNSQVAVDGFAVDSNAGVSQDAPRVTYDGWRTTNSASTSGGSYQSNAKAGASIRFTFSGVGITWVTATGPGYGFADVAIDGADLPEEDLFTETQRWQVEKTYSGLTDGSHTIVITPLGSHDPSSSGNAVVLDAFTAIPAPTLTGITVTPADATLRQDQTQQYTATGNYSDGSTQDLTTQVTWSTSSSQFATISNTAGSQGLLTAVGGSQNGTSIQVKATLGSVFGTTNLGLYCRLHQNGLGGTYSDCSPLGTPGNAATYSETMAFEAATAWGHGTPEMLTCGTSSPFQHVVAVDNANGPSATWSYTNGTGASQAGYVFVNSNGPALCPLVGDPTWN